MPVLPRPSKRYDVVGENVTSELVEWLNAVEDELNDLMRLRQENELHFARLETRMAQHLGHFRAELLGPRKEFITSREDTVGLGIWVRSELRQFRADLLRWMFVFWITGLVGISCLILLLGQ